MDHFEAIGMAKDLLSEHGFPEVKVFFKKTKRNFATAHFTPITLKPDCIKLSIEFVLRNNRDTVRELILHEIAHFVAGPYANHGHTFKLACMQIGAKSNTRFLNRHVEVNMSYRYHGYCPTCKKVVGHFHRRGKRMNDHYCYNCKKRYGVVSFLTWTDTRTGKIVKNN